MARAWGRTLAGVALFPVHGMALTRLAAGAGGSARLVAVASLAALVWLSIFGLTGLFVRYMARPSALGRYLADASYWFYLIHLPLVAWGGGLVSALPWPAVVKYLTLLGGVVLVCLVTYEIAVRPTFLGIFLNGRRLTVYSRLLGKVPAMPYMDA